MSNILGLYCMVHHSDKVLYSSSYLLYCVNILYILYCTSRNTYNIIDIVSRIYHMYQAVAGKGQLATQFPGAIDNGYYLTAPLIAQQTRFAAGRLCSTFGTSTKIRNLQPVAMILSSHFCSNSSFLDFH
jgi:hypothetical protein